MSDFVMSIKRLFMSNKIDIRKIEQLLADNKITREEMLYIIA